jgi:hypothetical protein
VACVNGCVLGEKCPHREYAAAASKFIQETSLDRMLEMADEAVRRKMMQPPSESPQWVYPDFLDKDKEEQ